MDSIRMKKDSHYYRNLLFKYECRTVKLFQDHKIIQKQNNELMQSLDQHSKTIKRYLVCIQMYVYFILIFQFAISLHNIKDYTMDIDIDGYSNKMFHMWQGYWKQICMLFELAERWFRGEQSTESTGTCEVLLQENDTWTY